jgi:ABC-type antimicrobial peptide transport system permease subunit
MVLELDPNLPLYFVRSMEQVRHSSFFFYNLFGALFSTFAVAALALASVGVYGVTDFSLRWRVRELAIRMACGATRGDVLELVLKQVFRQVCLGLAFGLGASLGLGTLITAFLYQVEPRDPFILLLIPNLLTAVSLLACWGPARRAAGADALAELRCG